MERAYLPDLYRIDRPIIDVTVDSARLTTDSMDGGEERRGRRQAGGRAAARVHTQQPASRHACTEKEKEPRGDMYAHVHMRTHARWRPSRQTDRQTDRQADRQTDAPEATQAGSLTGAAAAAAATATTRPVRRSVSDD
eukprot:GHVU01121852.1.p2 GENE.GHVU01121852.1~~GHVU01121852.1.p2  ORF type:complete len:138 (+),score=26.46 GHVU01121852.1:156-569(+)